MRGLGLALSIALAALAMPASSAASSLPAGQLFPLGCIGDPTSNTPCSSAAEDLDEEAVTVGPDDRTVYAQGSLNRLIALSRGESGRLAYMACNDFNAGDCGAENRMKSLLQGVDDLVAGPGEIYFVGTTNGGNGTVGAGRIRADGTLEELSCFVDFALEDCTVLTQLASASALAISPDAANVYVTNAGSDAVLTFAREPDGSLTYVECHASGAGTCGAGQVAEGLEGTTDVAVSPDGTSVYVASFGPAFGTADGAVAAFDRAADGTLTPNGCVEHTGAPSSCAANMSGLADPSAVVASTEAVYVASRDDFEGVDSTVVTLPRAPDGSIAAGTCIAATGSAECGGATAPGLRSPFELILGTNPATLHLAGLGETSSPSLDGAVATFTIAPGGALTPAGCVAGDAAAAGCGASEPGLGTGSGTLALSADGANVYAGGDDSIAELGREAAPVCSDSVASTKGVAVAVRLPCGDLNGDELAYAAPTRPSHGKLGPLGSVGQATYAPTPGFVGSDSFTFTATGGILTTAPSTARITVSNRRPAIRRLRVRRGKVRFRLTEPARVTLTFARKGGRRFVKLPRKLRLRGKTGKNARKLPKRVRKNPGAYRVSARARDPQGLRSKLAKRKFKQR